MSARKPQTKVLPLLRARGRLLQQEDQRQREQLSQERKVKAAKRQLMLTGIEALNRNSRAARAYIQTRAALIEQLGGPERVAPTQEHLIEIATRGLIYLGHIDLMLLERPHLLMRPGNKSHRTKLVPLVMERMAMSRIVAQQLQMLGFTRVTKMKSLAEDLLASPELLSKDGAPIPEDEGS